MEGSHIHAHTFTRWFIERVDICVAREISPKNSARRYWTIRIINEPNRTIWNNICNGLKDRANVCTKERPILPLPWQIMQSINLFALARAKEKARKRSSEPQSLDLWIIKSCYVFWAGLLNSRGTKLLKLCMDAKGLQAWIVNNSVSLIVATH